MHEIITIVATFIIVVVLYGVVLLHFINKNKRNGGM